MRKLLNSRQYQERQQLQAICFAIFLWRNFGYQEGSQVYPSDVLDDWRWGPIDSRGVKLQVVEIDCDGPMAGIWITGEKNGKEVGMTRIFFSEAEQWVPSGGKDGDGYIMLRRREAV